MTEQQNLPSDESYKEVSEDAQDQVAVEAKGEDHETPGVDDSPELRLQLLSAEYARERAALAEQISQLQEENDRLTQRILVIEQASTEPEPAITGSLLEDDSHPERALGLNFNI